VSPAGDKRLTITLQECGTCHRRWRTELAGCPYCGGTALTLRRFPGRGAVYSWVEVHRSLEDPPAAVPYTVLTVDLDAGARVFGRYAPGGEPRAHERVVTVPGSATDQDAPAFEPEHRPGTLAHGLQAKDRLVRAGRWDERSEHVGPGTGGRTIGIIGLGNVGDGVARTAEPFGLRRLAFDPYVDAGSVRVGSSSRISRPSWEALIMSA
jgi:hypothetical protein